MQNYWDKTDKEKSKITEEEMETFVQIELMDKGIAPVHQPVLKEVKKVDLKTKTYYAIDDLMFETYDEAMQVLKLKPKKKNYDYLVGYNYLYICDKELKIEQIELYSKDDLNGLKSILVANKIINSKNEELTEEYEKYLRKSSECSEELWESFWKCKRLEEHYKNIESIFEEYLKLTNGDKTLASKFLRKAFSNEEIEKAQIWLNKSFSFFGEMDKTDEVDEVKEKEEICL